MIFREQYTELEREFQEQVERDNKELGIKSGYVHNFIPQGPVDYILIAMEPSTGVPGKDRKDSNQITRNFSWSVEDYIFHYCIRKYLLQKTETYHLTDLSKGGMEIREAKKEQYCRYGRWYPLLEKEICLLSKPGKTRLIAIGNDVDGFLKKKGKSVEKVLHYSRNAASHRTRKIQPWSEHFPDFSKWVDEDAFKRDFEESIKAVLHDACMDSYIGYRPEGGKPIKLTESRKKLMFYYKNKFSQIRQGQV